MSTVNYNNNCTGGRTPVKVVVHIYASARVFERWEIWKFESFLRVWNPRSSRSAPGTSPTMTGSERTWSFMYLHRNSKYSSFEYYNSIEYTINNASRRILNNINYITNMLVNYLLYIQMAFKLLNILSYYVLRWKQLLQAVFRTWTSKLKQYFLI